VLTFAGCSNAYLEVDIDQLEKKIYEPTAIQYEVLNSSTVLYLDHSTCVIDANKKSPVFKALKGQLGKYTDTLRLIRGQVFDDIINTDKSSESTVVYTTIKNISADIPFADIGRAIKQICDGNSQAILITDCEYFNPPNKEGNQDESPYMLGDFRNWIKKGHCIYIVTEPYPEKYKGKMYDKKRFYFFFTDDKIKYPIINSVSHELWNSLQNGLCSLFKLTNSDISMHREKDKEKEIERKIKMVPKELTFEVTGKDGKFDYIEIDDDWETIREYVMKLDKYGEPLDNDEGTGKANPVPLVQNLVFNDGKNYDIIDVEVVATNITSQYIALDETVESKVVPIPDGFTIDKNALKNNKLNVFVTEKIFNYLTDEYCGNLIRLDFVVTRVDVNPYDKSMFTWKSMYAPGDATCVSNSIRNVLELGDISPGETRKVIHTVFIKTASYK
jgi:hypothetical protein